ncbi:MAG: allantoicase [Acidimicrobiia bacterium]|jgi:allantoicase
MIDLLSERVGGHVIDCNDEFFAPASNLIANPDPVWKEGEYTDRGKWMDGWETRRRRDVGHDWCVLRLGIPGRIARVAVDTSHFTGNYPEHFSLEASGDGEEWIEIIPRTQLSGDSVATFEVTDPHRVELVRLNIYPDGGVARLRVEGEPIPAVALVCPDGEVDLASAAVGGQVVDASDLHYSHPANCLRPTASAGMWDGWETRRRRDDGHDWVTVRLGMSGVVDHLVVDTTHFKGNAPGWVSAEASEDGSVWSPIVERVPVAADTENVVTPEHPAPASFLRLSIHPDGGVARLRVMGRPRRESAGELRIAYLNALFDGVARHFFHTACASSRWVEQMLDQRPFPSPSAVFDAAEGAFEHLEEDDWFEAFAGHPRIGETGDAVASREQFGARGHEAELAEVNAEYESRFGFIYIIYASDKTGEEMLEIARSRLENDRVTEIGNAASAQREITATRLRRMLCQEDS